VNKHLAPVAAALGVVLTACGPGQFLGPTLTPVPTSTFTATSSPLPTATYTPTSTPTRTPTPTMTLTPTPAAVGQSVPYGSLEITVLKIDKHDFIVPTGYSGWRPKDPTKIFLDLGVLVQNHDPAHTVSAMWKDVAITEANGESSAPVFADSETMEPGSDFDPFRIGISTMVVSDRSTVFLEKDTYLRLVYVVARNQTIVFQIQDSPTIAFAMPE
jgi:hypothetical protein